MTMGSCARLPCAFQRRDDGFADVGDGVGDFDADGVQRFDLVRRRAFAAADDGASVAHALARRRLAAGDEGRDRLVRHVLFDPFRSVFFGRAADLADHEDGERVGVVLERFERVDEVRALDRVAADADGRRLADAGRCELERRLVRQRAGAADDADMSFPVDIARDDAELRLVRREDARAVRADEARFLAFHVAAHADHVLHGDVLRDADDEVELRVDRFEDGVRCEFRRDEDDGSIRARRLHGVAHRVEDVDAARDLAGLARRDAADDFRAVINHLLRMERRGLARDALDDDFGVFIDENSHVR